MSLTPRGIPCHGNCTVTYAHVVWKAGTTWQQVENNSDSLLLGSTLLPRRDVTAAISQENETKKSASAYFYTFFPLYFSGGSESGKLPLFDDGGRIRGKKAVLFFFLFFAYFTASLLCSSVHIVSRKYKTIMHMWGKRRTLPPPPT